MVLIYPKTLAEQWTNKNNGWTGAKQYANLSNQKWTEKFTVTDWDPEKDDIAEGEFANGLQWEYRDDIGQIRFIGEGEVPDFPADALPTWSSQEDVNHMQDIKLVDTGDASRIGSNALNGAGKLVRILAGDKLKQIGDMAFANCENLEIVRIQGVEQIGNGAFKNCKKLQFIIIPKKVTTIGKKAFAGCTNLNYMLVRSDQIKSVGSGAFQGITSKMTVKTSKAKWRKYATMFVNRGKMSHNALFIIDPVKLKYKGRLY